MEVVVAVVPMEVEAEAASTVAAVVVADSMEAVADYGGGAYRGGGGGAYRGGGRWCVSRRRRRHDRGGAPGNSARSMGSYGRGGGSMYGGSRSNGAYGGARSNGAYGGGRSYGANGSRAGGSASSNARNGGGSNARTFEFFECAHRRVGRRVAERLVRTQTATGIRLLVYRRRARRNAGSNAGNTRAEMQTLVEQRAFVPAVRVPRADQHASAQDRTRRP